MKVFISWSGERSKAIAELLRAWLPAVLQAVRPYYSPDDIAKGTRWSGEIAKELEASRVGLICLTTENLAAPWVMFEAGALSKNLERSHVCPLLFGVEPTDIEGPLVQFQAAKFGKAEMERVVRMMNGELGDQALSSSVLDSVFEMWWPKLESSIREELSKPETSRPTARSERDLLEEVLSLTRSLSRNARDAVSQAALLDLEDGHAALLAALDVEGVDESLRAFARSLSRPIEHICARAHRRMDVIAHLSNRVVRRRASPEQIRDRLLAQTLEQAESER